MVNRPDPLESTPPAFGEETAREILREGFGVPASSLHALAGERDQNFRADTAEVRDTEWSVPEAPKPLDDRRVEITGPVERKMMINALNSGAKVWLMTRRAIAAGSELLVNYGSSYWPRQ